MTSSLNDLDNKLENKVVVLDSAILPDSEECLIEEELLKPYAQLSQVFVRSDQEIIKTCRKANAIILWHHAYLTQEILEELECCQVIVRNGVGFDNVDVEAASRLSIPVCNVPDYGTEEVADHALTLALNLARNLSASSRDVQQGNWNWRSAMPIRRFRKQVFGILGCGRIGTCAALRAKAFGFQVNFFDPYLPDGYEKSLGIHRCKSLEGFLRSVDILSIHVPLNQNTLKLISEKTLSFMKKGSILVNTSRGPVVDEIALFQALESGHIAAAGLDVVEDETKSHQPLSKHPQCIITPHCAFYSEDSWKEMRTKSCLTVIDALLKKPLRNVVNGVHVVHK